MKLLILGGGSCQINGIKRAKEMGIDVVVSDYLPDAPGKSLADFSEMTSTFDHQGILDIAKKHHVDGIMTLGTDQPVYTCSYVAEQLALPSYLDAYTAKSVTNKKLMKTIMSQNNIPAQNYTFISKGFDDKALSGLTFPLVIKPLDSQGQRGVYKLQTVEAVRSYIHKTLSFSRENSILVEEYYPSDEITVSGWVNNGKVHILTITDRLTFESPPVIGISYGHIFPSKHLSQYSNTIQQMTFDLVKAFNIQNGPIYFQMLVGHDGVKVNEIACRIGGAFEDQWIPHLTGVNLLNMVIQSSLGNPIDAKPLSQYDLSKNKQYLSVQLFFAKAGKIDDMTPFSELNLPFVIGGRHNFSVGDTIASIENASQRAGYMIITGKTRKNLDENINQAFKHLKIMNGKNNLIIPYWIY